MLTRQTWRFNIHLLLSLSLLLSQTASAASAKGATSTRGTQLAQVEVDPLENPPTMEDPSSDPGIDLPLPTPNNNGGVFMPSGPSLPGGVFGGSNGYYPPGSPYAPWDPYNTYGNGGYRRGMIGIQQTMVPGVVCPLVDDRPNVDIKNAIDNLFQYVLPTDNCFSQTDIATLGTYQTNMKQAGDNLSQMYKNMQSGVIDPNLDPAMIQQNISAVVTGMDQVAKTIANSPIAGGSRCNQDGLRGGQLFKAMGSLAGSIAPIALMLAATVASGGAAPAVVGGVAAGATVAKPLLAKIAAPALKYVLGTFALGTAVGVYYDIKDADTIDMRKPDQREALLQNLCEYFRIEQRVNYLKMADMGAIQGMTERMKAAQDKLAVFKKSTKNAMNKDYPKHVQQLAAIEGQVESQLNQFARVVRSDKKDLADVTRFMTEAGNMSVCTMGSKFAKQAGDVSKFPGRTLSNYHAIMKKQTRVTTAQELMVQADENLREVMSDENFLKDSGKARQCAPGTQCTPYARCADITKDYMKNLNKMITDADSKIKVLQRSMDTQLAEVPEYREYKTTLAAVEQEVSVRESTGKLIAMLSGDNASIVRSEIDRQMDVIKRNLFSGNYRRESPVRKWLESTEEQFRITMNTFSEEYRGLTTDAKMVTRSYRGEFKVKQKDGTIKNMSTHEVNKQILDDIQAVNKLGVINTSTVPANTPQHENLCRKLTNLNLQWKTAIDNLKAQKFFCDNIKTMIDARAEGKINEHCIGNVNTISGQVYKESEINKMLMTMSKSYLPQATLVFEKHKEIGCEIHDMADPVTKPTTPPAQGGDQQVQQRRVRAAGS